MTIILIQHFYVIFLKFNLFEFKNEKEKVECDKKL